MSFCGSIMIFLPADSCLPPQIKEAARLVASAGQSLAVIFLASMPLPAGTRVARQFPARLHQFPLHVLDFATQIGSPAPPAWLGFAPVIFVLLWSTGFIGARLTGPYAEPLSFLTIRFAIVAVLLGAAGLVMRARWPDRRLALHCMITGALMHGGYLGFVFWSIWKGMPAGVSALIVGLQPLVTALLAGMMLGERITRGTGPAC
jgi:hypothetical protein